MSVIHINDLQFCLLFLTKQLIYLLHLIIVVACFLMAEEIQTVKLFYVSVKGRSLNDVDGAEERVSAREGENKTSIFINLFRLRAEFSRNIIIVVTSRCYLLNSCQFKIH